MMFNFRLHFGPSLFLILVLISSACAPAVRVDYTPPQPSPTPSAMPVAVQPTQPATPQAPLQARLAVLTSRANILWGGKVETVIQRAQSTDVQIHNGIETV